MSDFPIWPSTLPPCPVASAIIRRLAEAGPDYVERMWAMSDIVGRIKQHLAECDAASCQELEPDAVPLLDGAIKEIERLRSERKWIPVSERLPECSADGDMESVLGYYPDFQPAILLVWYTGHRWEDGDGSGRRMKAPTYWMPLPEPPSA